MSHDNWRTPPELFNVLDKEFAFDCDAAATDKNTLCGDWITAEENALTFPWEWNTLFCNPPYSLIGPFVERAYRQTQILQNTAVVLIPAYTDPRYWSDYVMNAHEVRFLKGRLSFLDEDGMKKTSARFPSVVVVFKWLKGIHYGKAPNTWCWDWRK